MNVIADTATFLVDAWGQCVDFTLYGGGWMIPAVGGGLVLLDRAGERRARH